MNRIIRILLILGIGSLVLWESISWGTRTWVKYGLMKEPLPSITTFLPISMIQPLIMLAILAIISALAFSAILRARRIFGIIPIEELKRHVVILGPTGSGKTTVAKAIIEKALKSMKNLKVVIIDWKGEYAPLFPGATVIRKINLWDLGGRNAAERAAIAVELLREVTRDIADISSASATLLLKELVKLYSEKGKPTTKDVVEKVERFMQNALTERRLAEANMAAAILRRLYWLQIDEERTDENIDGSHDVVIYDLSSTGSNYLKTLYSLSVLVKKYYEALKGGLTDELIEIIIAEECQNYLRARRPDDPPSIGERLVFELRSFGVGVVLVCPDPTLLSEAVTRDVRTIVSTSPDTLPRFVLERFLFRASLEEAEDVLKRLKKARMIIYHAGKLHFLRRLPRSKTLKPKAKPKGDRMGVTDPGGRSLRAWPILPHRSPGRPATEVKKEDIEERPKVIEIREVAAVEEKPKVVEVVEELKLEEEELEEPEAIEAEVEKSSKPIEVKKEKVSEEEKEVMVEEEVPIAVELEPAPEGPPIPSTLPYRGSLCPAGRSTTLGRALLLEEDKNSGWWVSGKVGTKFPVGDPLTPGGGPGRAELRLEEEEGVEKVIEGEATESQVQREEVSETPSSQEGWEIFGHLLVEDLQVRGRTSVMRCARCGASAPLTGLKVLREIPCTPKEVVRAEKLTKKCENCGREGATATLCDECANVFEKYAETARPMPLRGLGGVKPPSAPGVDGWAWVSFLATFFPFRNLEGGGREWWCPVPGCKVTAKRLIDVVDHFRDAHPVVASRGWYEEFDTKTKKTRIRNWQGWVDEEKLELVLEPEVEKR